MIGCFSPCECICEPQVVTMASGRTSCLPRMVCFTPALRLGFYVCQRSRKRIVRHPGVCYLRRYSRTERLRAVPHRASSIRVAGDVCPARRNYRVLTLSIFRIHGCGARRRRACMSVMAYALNQRSIEVTRGRWRGRRRGRFYSNGLGLLLCPGRRQRRWTCIP